MYLKADSIEYDRSEIFAAAHQSAQLYARACNGYRHALRQALRDAWKAAITERTDFVLHGGRRNTPLAVQEINRAIFMLQMRDRLSPADFDEIRNLQAKAASLSKQAA